MRSMLRNPLFIAVATAVALGLVCGLPVAWLAGEIGHELVMAGTLALFALLPTLLVAGVATAVCRGLRKRRGRPALYIGPVPTMLGLHDTRDEEALPGGTRTYYLHGVEVSRPGPGTLRISRQGQAKARLIWAGLLTVGFAVALGGLFYLAGGEEHEALDFLCPLELVLIPALLVFPLVFRNQIRMLLSRQSLTFTRGSVTVEHAGRPTTHYLVNGIQINTSVWGDPLADDDHCTHTLFVVTHRGRRLTICESSDARIAEMNSLAGELAAIVGVEVTSTSGQLLYGH